MAKTTTVAPKPDTTTSHVYGTTCYGWVVGQSVDEVVKRLATDVSPEGYKRGIAKHIGLEVWTYTVPLPQTAAYEINGFIPTVTPDGAKIELSDTARHVIINAKGDYITPRAVPSTR
jgi:hypothetical protein